MNLWNLRAFVYEWLRRPWPLSAILKRENANILELLELAADCRGPVVDIGCGTGNSLSLVYKEHIIALDQAPRMAKETRLRFQVPAIVASAEHLPFKTHSISLFLFIGIAEYIKRIDRLFEQLVRTGAPNCYVLLTISPATLFTYLRFIGGSHLWPRRETDIIGLCHRYGFEIIGQKNYFSQSAFLLKRW